MKESTKITMPVTTRGATDAMVVCLVSVPTSIPTSSGGERAGQRVERASGLDELIALVASASEKIEHRVHHGVEHADAKTADKRAQGGR